MDDVAAQRARVPEIDLARGLAVLFMVFVHVLEEWATLPVQRATFGRVVEFFGSAPAAPVFMVLMGASVAFSRRVTVRAMVRRGAELLALGFLLNALRGALPAQIGLSLGLVTPEALGPYTPWNLLWIVDVLGFAGPALAVLGLVGALRRPWVWVALAAAVAAVSPLLWGIEAGVPVVDGVLRHLWGTGALVSFPMFPWLAFPLVGMAWGTWRARADDERRVYLWTLVGGVVLMAAGTGFLIERGGQLLGDHWRLGPDGVAWVLGFVSVWVCLLRWAVRALPANPAFATLAFWSRNVTRFYFVQWLLIAWGTGVAGHHALGVWPTVASQLGIAVAAHGLTWAWVRWRRLRQSRRRDRDAVCV
jgi:surface polysaccharide O-acyltransferase-like enzyme